MRRIPRKKIYNRIYSDLLEKMKKGMLMPGDLLPSTRQMAQLYGCHRLTVMGVCQDLIAEGWIESSERSCYRVSLKVPVISSSLPASSARKRNLASVAKPLPLFDLERTRYRIEFWGGQPDLRLFPMDEFRKILSAALRRTKPDQLNYGQTMGLPSCLKEVSDYLRKSRSLLNKEFLITNGSQEALLLIAQTFINPGEKIAVERKGYPPAWRLFESLGASLIPIEIDSEGIQTDDLQEKMQEHKIKLIYLTPLHQYPTTVTLSPRRRQSLIQIAEKNMIPILEDDYDHEFHYVGPPPAPLSSETDQGIYVCSFSKILFPGARLGVIGCDSKILEMIGYHKYLSSRQTDCLSQIGLSAWIRDGGFDRHLRRMRRIYEMRSRYMQDRLVQMQGEVELDWQAPTGGMSIWVNVFRNSKKISEEAKSKGVLFQYENQMDYKKSLGTHLRIGFAGVNQAEIDHGFGILKKLLKSGPGST